MENKEIEFNVGDRVVILFPLNTYSSYENFFREENLLELKEYWGKDLEPKRGDEAVIIYVRTMYFDTPQYLVQRVRDNQIFIMDNSLNRTFKLIDKKISPNEFYDCIGLTLEEV